MFEKIFLKIFSNLLAENSAHSNNKENIEYGASNNGTNTNIGFSEEYSLKIGKILHREFLVLPITEVKSSGALPPAAIIVAPATSSDMSSFSVIT